MNNMIEIYGYTINIPAVAISLFFVVLVWGLFSSHKKKELDWRDMLTRDGNKVSTTKLLQLIGGVVATWVIVKLTLTQQLSAELFVIYLAYVASIDGFSKWILAKYGAAGSDDTKVPYKKSEADTGPTGSAKAE
jgi:Ca2+/Na+ antiporter